MSKDVLWYVSKVYDWLADKAGEKLGKIREKLGSYYSELKFRFRLIKKRLTEKWLNRWKPILNYGAFTLTPYVLAYGVLLNIVTFHFVQMDFSLTSVAAHGLLFYFVKEELTEIAESLRPTIKADVKVKDR